jgi:hypothetical protein
MVVSEAFAALSDRSSVQPAQPATVTSPSRSSACRLPQLGSGIRLGAGSCARCVDDECDSILEALLARSVD